MNKNLLLTLLLAIVLAACTDSKRYVVGVSQCSVDNWRDKFNKELVSSSYLYENVRFDIESANDNDQQQTEQINRLIDNGVDLLIVSPNKVNTISAVLQRANEKGIPVILFDRKTAVNGYTAFIGADNRRIGREMGEYLVRRMNGKGRIVEVLGLCGSSPTTERHEGFVEALRLYPDMKIVASVHGDWLRKSAMKVVADSVVARGVEFDCVFAQNDRMALGARDAIANSAATADNIIYVGVDALPAADEGLTKVRDGELDASYIYPTRGDIVMQLAMDILEGQTYERENKLVGTLVTKDNVNALLLQNEELERLQSRLGKLHDRVDFYFTQYSHQRVYAVLMMAIIVLVVAFVAVGYRAVVARRRIMEEATNAKLRFFTNVSHEFRTPITLLADPIDRLLADKDTTENQRRLLMVMRRNVGVLLRLVGNILDFRKAQSGKLNVSLSQFDLCDSLRSWIETFLPMAEHKSVVIALDIPDRLELTSDKSKIERICYNLVANAMKYTSPGGRITLTVSDNGDGTLKMTVADTGVGIPRDQLPYIFDRFFQVKDQETENTGTGIGLAVVKELTEALGGSVAVESVEGQGTTFTVSLPLKSGGEMASTNDEIARNTGHNAIDYIDENIDGNVTQEQPTSTPESRTELPVVLLVDDNDDILSYVSSLLGGSYNVLTASNGKEGLDIALKEVPDVVVCDVMMPVMDGLELCRRLKQDTVTSHVPVLILTARTLEGQRIEGYDCGADAYLTKPFSGTVLASRIRNLLDNRRLLQTRFSKEVVTATETRQPNTDTLFVENLRKKVLARLDNSDFNVEVLGAEMGMSRVQLYRKVKALTGMTLVELVRVTRLRKADEMLAAGGKSVSEVAYAVGFSSPSYFSKCYKDFFGHTPNMKS